MSADRQSAEKGLAQRFTRGAAVVAAAVLAVLVGLALGADHLLLRQARADAEIAQQQLARELANALDDRLLLRKEVLSMTGALLGARDWRDEAQMQRFFADRPAVRSMFDFMVIVDQAGDVLFDDPFLPSRRGVNVTHVPQLNQLLQGGRDAVTSPYVSRLNARPAVVLSVPLSAGLGGRVSGMLAGLIEVNDRHLTGRLAASRDGGEAHFALLSRGHMPSVVLQPGGDNTVLTPAQWQAEPALAAAMEGFEGTREAPLRGTASMSTARALKVVPWTLVVSQPMATVDARVAVARGLSAAAFSVAALLLLVVGGVARRRAVVQLDGQQPSQVLQQLLKSERRLRLITENVPGAVLYFDAQEVCRFSNIVFALPGGLPERGIGISLREHLGDVNYARVQPYLVKVMRGESVHFQLPFEWPGQPIKHFDVRYVPDRAADGTVTGFYGLALNVTEQKLAEQSVIESERRLRSITDNVPALITYIDHSHTYRFCNAASLDWLGLPPDQVVGRTMSEIVSPHLLAQRNTEMARALAGERVEFDFSADGRDGTKRHLRSALIPDERADGSIPGVYAMSTDVTSLKLVEEQLTALARFDELTGLPNRRQFDERLAEAMARGRRLGRPIAVMFLDIDRFKEINDGHGHGAGDEVLKQFAARLGKAVRHTDMVARLAGDEFVVVLEGLTRQEEAQFVARKVVLSTREPMHLGSETVLHITTSIGLAFYGGDALMTPSELMAKADQALYEVKSAGRNGYRLVVF